MTTLSAYTGIPRDSLYNWKAGKAAPKTKELLILNELFTNLEGKSKNEISLYLASKKPKEVIMLGKQVATNKSESDWEGLPVYNIPISASFVAQYHDMNFYQPLYHLQDPRFKDCNFASIITGDSMHSEIRHGDYVVCKEINDYRFIVFGDIYYVVATNGLETCKYVHPDKNNNDNILLVPRNEAIPPSPLPKEMILRMYKVKGIIRGY